MEITPEQMEIIHAVVNRIAPNHKFGFYEIDDIKQEAYILALEAMEKYDGLRPLENFISKHISNRLKSLRRDKYSRKNLNTKKHADLNTKKRLLMDMGFSFICNDTYESNIEDELSTREAVDKVLSELSPALKKDFLRLANKAPIQDYRKKAVYAAVKEILNEDW